MPKRKTPTVSYTHHRVEPPKYTLAEIEGLKEQVLRLTQHVTILQEEVTSKQAQIKGLKAIIKQYA